MYAPLIAMAIVTVLGAGGLSWLVARRLGARWALALPLLALAAFLGLMVLTSRGGGYDGLGQYIAAIFVAAPALTGAGLGIGFHLLQRRRTARRGR